MSGPRVMLAGSTLVLIAGVALLIRAATYPYSDITRFWTVIAAVATIGPSLLVGAVAWHLDRKSSAQDQDRGAVNEADTRGVVPDKGQPRGD
jgi:hypothetical protein